jgi:NHLM bacteriocin system ABC transporter ATP-binding protein
MQTLSQPSNDGRLVINGKNPVLLDDSGTIAIVEQGVVDVFFVNLDDDQRLTGPRKHITQMSAGEFMFAMRPLPDKGAFMAVGIGEAVLKTAPWRRVYDEDPALFHKNMDNWGNDCINVIMADQRSPSNYKVWDGAESFTMTPDTALYMSSPGGLLVAEDGEIQFLNQVVISHQHPLLIPGNSWITATNPEVLVNVINIDKAFIKEESWEGIIQTFQEYVASGLNTLADLILADDRERYQQQLKDDKRNLTTAIQKMAGILKHGKITPSLEGLPPLLAAAIVVAKAAGIDIAKQTANIKTGLNPDLGEISRHNRYRVREVVIADKWWNTDHGPLLAFRETDDAPVAIIPRGPNAYDCFEPDTGKTRQVDEKVADDIKPTAYMFYRPFPNKKLKWWDLLSFGVFNSGADFAWLLTMGTLAGLLGLLNPLAMGIIFGTFIPNAAKSDIVQITLILVATAISIGLFNIIKGFTTVRLEGRMDLGVQAAVWDRLLSLPVPFFKDYTSGDLASRSMGINSIRDILSGVTLNAILTLIFTSFNLLFLFYYDWQMALVAIFLTTIGAVITFSAGIVIIYYQSFLFGIQGRISGIMFQFVTGINKLRATGTEQRAFTVMAKEYVKQKQLNYKSGVVDAWLSAINAAFPILVSMVIFCWYYWMRPGYMTVAEFVAFSCAYTTFQTALLQLSMIMPSTANIIPLYQRAKPIFQALPEYDETSKKPGALTGNIDVDHVSFRYSAEGPLILKDVCLRAGRGEFIAVVGGSGAGKSTLLRLLLGFETPETGGVFFDGQELKNLDVREVRRQIGVVLQHGKLMSGDIYRNIVGTSNLTRDDAWEAARKVGFADDINAMPMKMHTIIPAGGGSLSGGQCQRMLIARAIAHRPHMLFFDEATSALDNQTQAIVSRSLEQLKVTRIVIAHRLSTIIHADRIYVMHLGQVVEEGNYETLMAQKGYFYELAKRQIS